MNLVWRIYRGIIISDNCQQSLPLAWVTYTASRGNEHNVLRKNLIVTVLH
jgi:hypothetical protein